MPIFPEEDLILSIIEHKEMYPTLTRTFEMTTALDEIIVALRTVEEMLSDGHKRLFNTIRDTIIKKWGRKLVKLSSKTFNLTERRIGQILADSSDLEQKMTDILDGRKRQFRPGSEDPSYWVNKLNDVLVKKSGEKSETLRSRWGKLEIYEHFVNGWYAETLDRQIVNELSLVEKAQSAKSST